MSGDSEVVCKTFCVSNGSVGFILTVVVFMVVISDFKSEEVVLVEFVSSSCDKICDLKKGDCINSHRRCGDNIEGDISNSGDIGWPINRIIRN